MFGSSDTKLPTWLILVVIALGLVVGFRMAVSDKDPDADRASERAMSPDQPTPPSVSRDAATGQAMMAGGAAIMPDDLAALDPSQYSEALAGRIPVEVGMEQFAAKDEFLVYYNSDPGPSTRVSMTEKSVSGATVFVIRRLGMADDSVAGEESFAVFDAGKLAAYGSRVKCHRGANPNAWTTELCP